MSAETIDLKFHRDVRRALPPIEYARNAGMPREELENYFRTVVPFVGNNEALRGLSAYVDGWCAGREKSHD